jgi:hypothetical protein
MDDLDVIRLVAMDNITGEEYHRVASGKRPNFTAPAGSVERVILDVIGGPGSYLNPLQVFP